MASSAIKNKKKSPFGELLDAVRLEYSKLGPWDPELQRDLPKKWEKHGDMILLPENAFVMKEWRMLGRNLWKVVAECMQAQRVGRKRRIEKDEYGSPHIELLYGQHGWVEHVDNGISYHYDITKCMFSIGNINEKVRIGNFDCKNEVIVDMFAGIGYFTLPYLVLAKAHLVHACEWNPDAVEALRKNLIANNVDDRCKVHEGDCRKVCPSSVADRVNLGLLPTARAYWLTACKALKPTGGFLHIHENVTSSSRSLKKSMSRQDSIISNSSDVLVGDSVTIQYCYDEEDEEENPTVELAAIQTNGHDDIVKMANGSTSGQTNGLAGNLNLNSSEKLAKDNSESKGSKSAKPKSTSNGKPTSLDDSKPRTTTTNASIQRDSTPPKKPNSKSTSPEPAIVSSSDSNSKQAQMLTRKDSLFEEELDTYEPPIADAFKEEWMTTVDGSWKQFSLATARRIRRFLNNLSDGEWRVSVSRIGKIKSYAPRVDHIVLDLECRPIE